MGRRRKFSDAGCTVCGYVEYSITKLLDKIAVAKGITRSEAVREAIIRYVEEEATKLGMQVVFTHDDGEGGEVRVRHANVLQILNEGGLEDLEEQVAELEKTVAVLERVAAKKYYGHGYYAPDFKKELDYAWSRMLSMKKLAEKLARLDMLDVELARRVVSIERRLKKLRKRR